MKNHILVTNDDGIHSPGIAALAESLSGLGEVMVVAPSTERSAVSHGLTLNSPLRVHQVAERWYAVDGTPADCVLLAVNQLLPWRPGLIASGINAGANLGDDVMYSGTVAGAREGSLCGIPSLAFSLSHSDHDDFSCWQEHVRRLSRLALELPVPAGTFWNINFPPVYSPEYRITKLCQKIAASSVLIRHDPRGKPYYWIGDDNSTWNDAAGTDYEAIAAGCISISPLHRDMTAYQSLSVLEAALPMVEKTNGLRTG